MGSLFNEIEEGWKYLYNVETPVLKNTEPDKTLLMHDMWKNISNMYDKCKAIMLEGGFEEWQL